VKYARVFQYYVSIDHRLCMSSSLQVSMSATEVLRGDSVPLSNDPAATQMSSGALSGTQGSPWGVVKVPPWGSPGVVAAPTCSLEDVMSEELVKQLQQEELPQEGQPR